MLEKLIINNYALIEQLDLSFSMGLTIITGETGAGKSIMLGALGLLLGDRADSKAIGDKSRKTMVEATFSHLPQQMAAVFEKNNLEWEGDTLIVRRELSPSGRSRAFINDTPVTLPTLSEVTSLLLDIHSQHNNLILQNQSNHLTLLDDFSNNDTLLNSYRELFSQYVSLRQKIKKLKDRIEKDKEKREFIAFRLEQLDKIKPKEGELENIEKEFDLLSDAEQIRNDLGEACAILNENDNSVLSSISSVESLLGNNELSLISDEDEDILERILNIKVELRDIYESLSSYMERVESNPSRLAKLSGRMNLLYDTIKRFKVKDEKELIELYEELQTSLENIDTGDEELKDLEKQSRELALKIKNNADLLSESRKKNAGLFCDKLMETAKPLGLPNLSIQMDITPVKLTSDGQDKATLLCSFNKNHPLQSISAIASGGELARLMLSLKSIMTNTRNLPTIIFDEIDTGVSGEIADKMGRMMKEMAKNLQVIVITHLPQVAAKGDTHFKVYKTDTKDKTISHIRSLSHDERLKELASMLSGSNLNKEALANAEVMLKEGMTGC